MALCNVASLWDFNPLEVLEPIINCEVCGKDMSYLLLYFQCLKYGRHLMDIFERIDADLD